MMRGLVSGRCSSAGSPMVGDRQACWPPKIAPSPKGCCCSPSLHPPGRPQQARTSHWPALRTPALFVHGSRDPFASSEELRAALELIPAQLGSSRWRAPATISSGAPGTPRSWSLSLLEANGGYGLRSIDQRTCRSIELHTNGVSRTDRGATTTTPLPDSFASDILRLRRVCTLRGNGKSSAMPPAERS